MTPTGAKWIIAEQLAARGTGYVFTTPEVCDWVEDLTGKRPQHPLRRLSELRQQHGWQIDSSREDASLSRNQHRVVVIGDVTPSPRANIDTCPAPVRRAVFQRDGKMCRHCGRNDLRCMICGIAPGEHYADQPNGPLARMTIGRITPGSQGGRYVFDNCRTECARCNEHVRDTYAGSP